MQKHLHMLLTLLLLMVGVGAVSAETKTTGDGTEANPYTPTDLINLNKDNALPKTTIYVKGIITRVGSSKSSLKHGELDYYISNDGTKSNEIEIYGGLGLNGAKFTKTTELEAGWTVTVTGTPKEYKGTLELNYGNEITKIEKPTVPEPTISGTTSFLNNTQVTITVDNASAKVYYTLDGTTPNDKSTLYTAPFSLDKTTTVTAIAYVNGKAGKTVSMKFEKIDESQILTVAEALKKADNTEVYVKGTVVSTQKYNKKYTNLNYWITDGGASTDTLEVYRGTYLNGADITNDEQIMSGDEVILKATITTYKNSKTNVTTRELTPSTLLSLTQAKETATITDAGWATFVSKRAVDFSGSNVNAYTVKYDSLANTITLTPIEKIPGKTAVVVKGDAGSYNFDHAESADALTDNNLEFKYSDYTVKAEKTFYILAQNGDVCGFYPVKVNTTLPAYKGYLYIKSTATTKAKDFYAIGKTTTNINNAVINNAQRGIRYNLNGQRVSDSYKGVVIENGKKFVVK